tara:strand:+ start:867 stop:1067 length:201 start_codon:yes stop_codon:yes gene_type:complete
MHIRPFIPSDCGAALAEILELNAQCSHPSVDGPDLTHRVADHFTPDRKLADPPITLDTTDMGDILL